MSFKLKVRHVEFCLALHQQGQGLENKNQQMIRIAEFYKHMEDKQKERDLTVDEIFQLFLILLDAPDSSLVQNQYKGINNLRSHFQTDLCRLYGALKKYPAFLTLEIFTVIYQTQFYCAFQTLKEVLVWLNERLNHIPLTIIELICKNQNKINSLKEIFSSLDKAKLMQDDLIKVVCENLKNAEIIELSLRTFQWHGNVLTSEKIKLFCEVSRFIVNAKIKELYLFLLKKDLVTLYDMQLLSKENSLMFLHAYLEKLNAAQLTKLNIHAFCYFPKHAKQIFELLMLENVSKYLSEENLVVVYKNIEVIQDLLDCFNQLRFTQGCVITDEVVSAFCQNAMHAKVIKQAFLQHKLSKYKRDLRDFSFINYLLIFVCHHAEDINALVEIFDMLALAGRLTIGNANEILQNWSSHQETLERMRAMDLRKVDHKEKLGKSEIPRGLPSSFSFFESLEQTVNAERAIASPSLAPG